MRHSGDGDPGLASHSELAPDDGFVPIYGKPELEKVLVAERAAEASGARQLVELEAGSDDDATRVARANLDVRRRFIAMLESCQVQGRSCPPRLDEPAWSYDVEADADPKLDVALQFDLAGWRAVTGELHGRACACRTLDCVDSLEVAIARLESRPAHDVAGDEPATTAVTRARECLFRLRGKHAEPHPPSE